MLNSALSKIGILSLRLMSLLPLSILYVIADFAYLLIYYVFGYRKKVVRTNLRNSFPEKSDEQIIEIEKKFFRYLTSLIVEVVKMDSMSEQDINKHVKFKNKDLVDAYLKNNESVLFCSSHFGNYEWVCMAIGLNFSAQHFAIYKPLTNEVFDKWFIDMRSRFGNQMISMRQTIRAVQTSKEDLTIFTFGTDQSPTPKDIQYWTKLLNQDAAVQLGIEKIAKKTNRPVFYLKISYLKRGYYEVDCVPICLEPQKTEEFEITEMHTRFLEEILKEEPTYWLWSHKRWKHQPVSKEGSILQS